MRVLCVGRHMFLSEHLCRFFDKLGAECTPAVGVAEVVAVAEWFDPHVIVADCDLLSSNLLDEWSRLPSLREVSVVAVSLTRRPEESVAPDICGSSAVVYLPRLGREQALALIAGADRPRGVVIPPGADLSVVRPLSVPR